MSFVQKRPISYIARERLNQERAQARHDNWTDPEQILVRAVRAANHALMQVGSSASMTYERENAPVMLPAGARPPELHPSRVAAILALMQAQGWSDDPRAPCQPMPTLAETVERATAESQAQLAKANAELEAFYDDRRRADLCMADPEDDSVPAAPAVIAEPPRRPRGRPRIVLDPGADVTPE